MARRKKTTLRRSRFQAELANVKRVEEVKQDKREKHKEKVAQREKEKAIAQERGGEEIDMAEAKGARKHRQIVIPQYVPPKSAPIPLAAAIAQARYAVENKKTVELSYSAPKKATKGIQKRGRRTQKKVIKIDVQKVVGMQVEK